VKGSSLTPINALPLMTFPVSPLTTAINLSVVGSGPMFMPEYSAWIKCLMKVVFPTEYCPKRRIVGFALSSLGKISGLWKSWKKYAFSTKYRYVSLIKNY
jgi:hypothetical protein